jgi:hypothetical protein
VPVPSVTPEPRSGDAGSQTSAPVASVTPVAAGSGQTFKDALLAEIRKQKAVFYNMVVAQAQKIEVAGDSVTFTFSPTQRTLRDTFEQNRTWLESVAQQASGRKIAVACLQTEAAAAPPPGGGAQKTVDKKSALREQALADAGVQAMLEVFPAEIRDVEEM